MAEERQPLKEELPKSAGETDLEKPASFEEAMERLEQVVRELESGELSLERSIVRFQEGMMLAKWCRDQLDRAEQRIEVVLQQEGGGWETRPFESRPGEDE